MLSNLFYRKLQLVVRYYYRLCFHCPPFTLLFPSLFSLSQPSHVLLDPTGEEQALCSGQVSVIVLAQMKTDQPQCELLGGLTKTGQPSLSSQQLVDFTLQAQKRGKLLLKLLHTALGKKS